MAPVASSSLSHPALLALHATAADTPQGLVALRAISNSALAEKELPKRLKLLNWGENATTKGPVRVGAQTLQHLAANQTAQGFEHIALDYNHNSLPGHPNFQPDPREIAAYGTVEVIERDGLYLTGLDYTPSGSAKALNYRDLSPTPLLNQDGEVIFLHSVALCPQGAVRDLSFYSAGGAGLQALAPDPVPPPVTATTLDYRTLLCAILGLDPALASDDDIAAQAQKMAEDARPSEGQPKPEPMSVRVERIERDLIVSNGLREGKLIPLAVRVLPVAQLRAIVAQLPAGQVPTDRQTPAILALTPGMAPNAAEEEVRQRLGIPKDLWQKHNS